MRHSTRLVLAALLAIALGGLGGGAAAAPSSDRTVHSGHVLEYVCHGKHYKPHTIGISCGDGNSFVRHLGWTSWTTHKAHGHGVWWQNNCKPDCGSGDYVRYPVRLRLSQVIARGNAKIFGRVVGIFPKRRPPYPAYKHHRVLVMNNGKQAP